MSRLFIAPFWLIGSISPALDFFFANVKNYIFHYKCWILTCRFKTQISFAHVFYRVKQFFLYRSVKEKERLNLNLLVKDVIDNITPLDRIKITIENELPDVLRDSVR